MLTLGEEVPSFYLPGVQHGDIKNFRLTDYRGNWLILFFYPEDFSFICPTEVMGFQRLYAQYRTQGYEVVGISIDSVETHRAWAEELGGINYPLVSDIEGKVCRLYHAFDQTTQRAVRATFIVDPKGRLQYCLYSNLNVGRSAEETLRVSQALLSGRQCPADWRP